MKTSNAVLSYTIATVEIYFPNENVCCAMCPLMDDGKRRFCRKTGEYIADDRYMGYWCPLKLEENPS